MFSSKTATKLENGTNYRLAIGGEEGVIYLHIVFRKG